MKGGGCFAAAWATPACHSIPSVRSIMLSVSCVSRNLGLIGMRHSHVVNAVARQSKTYSTKTSSKKALLMDANGILYKRNTKKLAALSQYLAGTGRYQAKMLDLDSLRIHADSLVDVSEEANKGTTNSRQYYMTLLLTLPIHPVDLDGALNAVKRAEYDITLFPGVDEALKVLKHEKGVKLGIITDSMASTTDKKDWMQKAGLDTNVFDVIVNSSEMGTTKPDPKMYQKALEKLGVTAPEAVFLGHRGSELEGAKEVGLSTLVMFPDPDLLEHGGHKLVRFDYYVPSWKHILDVPFWPSNK